MENARFDYLVRVITARHTSRRSLVTGLCALALAGVLQPAPGSRRRPGAATGTSDARRAGAAWNRASLTCSGDSCDGTGGKRCGGRDDCQCYRTPNGGNVCASSRQSSLDETCNTNEDCPRGQVCVEGGPACGGRGLRFCKQACSM